MLTNTFYTGRIRWKDLDVQGEHEALVDPVLFQRVQEVVNDRQGGPKLTRQRELPLEGLARCSHCKGHMTAEQHGRHAYYRCSRQANRRSACDGRYCRTDRADRDVEQVLRTVQITRTRVAEIEQRAHALIRERCRAVDRTAADIAQRMSQSTAELSELTELFCEDAVSSNAFRRRSFDAKETQSRLQRDSRALSLPPDQLCEHVSRILATATSVRDLFVTVSPARRHNLLRAVFSTVVLGSDGILGFVLRPPFEAIASGSPDVVDSLVDAAA